MRRVRIAHLFLMMLVGGWFVACSGANAPGGAVAPGGGPVGAPPGSGAAAQPMDTGFAGAGKDIEHFHYFLRDAHAQVLCGDETLVKVRFEGDLFSESPSGQTYAATGLFKVTDQLAEKFQVTQTSMEAGNLGHLNTVVKVQPGLQVLFSFLQNYSGPLETLEPVNPQAVTLAFPVEPRPELKVEQNNPLLPCMESVKPPQLSED